MHATKTKNVPATRAKNVPAKGQGMLNLVPLGVAVGSRARNVPVMGRSGATIGDKLQELLDEKGLSVAAAADIVGMSRQQLWRIIRGGFVRGGVKDPGFITIQRIVRALDSRVEDLCKDGDLLPTEGPYADLIADGRNREKST